MQAGAPPARCLRRQRANAIVRCACRQHFPRRTDFSRSRAVSADRPFYPSSELFSPKTFSSSRRSRQWTSSMPLASIAAVKSPSPRQNAAHQRRTRVTVVMRDDPLYSPTSLRCGDLRQMLLQPVGVAARTTPKYLRRRVRRFVNTRGNQAKIGRHRDGPGVAGRDSDLTSHVL